jgi:peptidoglycan/xylan/chitin deacetylase (PgdA/CDA1 family)
MGPDRAARWPQLIAQAVGTLTGTDVVSSVATDAALVALTVDDGPHPATTPALLDVLADNGVSATFFVMGSRAREHPDLLARAAAEGHELANHLERDEPSALLAAAEFDRQLADVHGVLAPHGPVRFFRPGSGWFTPRMLRSGARLGYRCALGSPGLAISSYPEPVRLGASLAARCGRGDVVVLHEGSASRADVATVAGALVTGLARRGLTATTLSRLVATSSPSRPGPGS